MTSDTASIDGGTIMVVGGTLVPSVNPPADDLTPVLYAVDRSDRGTPLATFGGEALQAASWSDPLNEAATLAFGVGYGEPNADVWINGPEVEGQLTIGGRVLWGGPIWQRKCGKAIDAYAGADHLSYFTRRYHSNVPLGKQYLQNPGFETLHPAGWVGAWERDDEHVLSGEWAAKIPDGGTISQVMVNNFLLEEGTRWLAEIYVWADAGASGGFLRINPPTGSAIEGVYVEYPEGTADWYLLRGFMVVNTGTLGIKPMTFEVEAPAGAGPVWVDDASFRLIHSDDADVPDENPTTYNAADLLREHDDGLYLSVAQTGAGTPTVNGPGDRFVSEMIADAAGQTLDWSAESTRESARVRLHLPRRGQTWDPDDFTLRYTVTGSAVDPASNIRSYDLGVDWPRARSRVIAQGDDGYMVFAEYLDAFGGLLLEDYERLPTGMAERDMLAYLDKKVRKDHGDVRTLTVDVDVRGVWHPDDPTNTARFVSPLWDLTTGDVVRVEIDDHTRQVAEGCRIVDRSWDLNSGLMRLQLASGSAS